MKDGQIKKQLRTDADKINITCSRPQRSCLKRAWNCLADRDFALNDSMPQVEGSRSSSHLCLP